MRRHADVLVAVALLAPFALATARGTSLPGSRFNPERPFVRLANVERSQGPAGPRLVVRLQSGRLYAQGLEVRVGGASLVGTPARIELPPEAEARVAISLRPDPGQGPLEIRVREVPAVFDSRGFDASRAMPAIACQVARPRGPACAFPPLP
jgi:hypothetical protein